MIKPLGACALALTAVIVACSDANGPQMLTSDAIVGTWVVTSLTVSTYTTPVQTRERIDPADLVSSVITVDASARYGRRDSLAWLPSAFIDSGTVVIHGDSLYFQSQFGPSAGTPHPRLQGNTLVLQDSTFDYLTPTSTSQEALRVRKVLVRQ